MHQCGTAAVVLPRLRSSASVWGGVEGHPPDTPPRVWQGISGSPSPERVPPEKQGKLWQKASIPHNLNGFLEQRRNFLAFQDVY